MYWLVASRLNNRHYDNGSRDIRSTFLAGGVMGGARLAPLDGGSGWARTRGGIRAESRVVGGGLILGSSWESTV